MLNKTADLDMYTEKLFIMTSSVTVKINVLISVTPCI
jgi:hypothetical protein